MAKKVKFESFVYRFLAEAASVPPALAGAEQARWSAFVDSLAFRYERATAVVSWGGDHPGSCSFALGEPDFHHRGDVRQDTADTGQTKMPAAVDAIQAANATHFRNALREVCERAGVRMPRDSDPPRAPADDARLAAEEQFHDGWAAAEDPGAIDVRAVNEACTSPEMRHIRARLGDLRGKKLLDVGCGLGEASVYFAMEGADVTSMDLSQRMLEATARLARLNGVSVRTHKAAAERTDIPGGETFDIIYAGNLLHHVDIASTLRLLKPHLAPGGTFVSWDPIAYNPVINVYRAIASGVRTPDEHPLKLRDIRMFRSEFASVETRYFWLTTLAIFLVMALVQRRNPNQERFWKAVVNESDRWEPLYLPLSKLDEILLTLLPPLRLLCWNVVVVARDPAPA